MRAVTFGIADASTAVVLAFLAIELVGVIYVNRDRQPAPVVPAVSVTDCVEYVCGGRPVEYSAGTCRCQPWDKAPAERPAIREERARQHQNERLTQAQAEREVSTDICIGGAGGIALALLCLPRFAGILNGRRS